MARVFHYFVYLLLRSLESVLVFVPLWFCWLFGSFIGWWAYWFLPGYRKIVRRNLLIALGDEMGAAECRRIAHRHFCALGRNLFCSIKISLMRPAAIEKRVRYEGQQILLSIFEENKGAIVAISHMGAWELLSQIASLGPGVKRASLYQALSNPFINKHIRETRAQSGLTLFDRRKGFYGPMKHLREGGGLGILVDQNAGGGGLWCPFFGRLASTSNLTALLSIRTGAPIVPVGLYPDGFAKWRVVYNDPIRMTDENGAELDSGQITAQLNHSMEQLIRRAPEEWFWVHDRWKTPNPEFLLSGYRRGVDYPPEFDVEKDLKPFRILVRAPNPLGDSCMSVPTVRAIKNGRPDAHVTVLCTDGTADLWNAVRHVDQVISVPRRVSLFKIKSLLHMWEPFDVGITFPNSLRSAMEMKFAGVPHVVGYEGHSRKRYLDQIVPERRIPGPPEHQAWRYMRIAHHIGADQTDPDLYAMRDNEPEFSGRWRIGLCPGAVYGEAKRYPTERFVKAVEEINDRLRGKVDWSIYGAPAEYEMSYYFQQKCEVELKNMVGQTSIAELMEELRNCHLLITNDTGTMHLAALLGVKTVAIFGSTEPSLTAPLGHGHKVIRRHVECSPCFLRRCPLDFRCMTSIGPDEITQAAVAVLGEGDPEGITNQRVA